jgi:hypothetical protein
MLRHLPGLCATVLACCVSPLLHAEDKPPIALVVEITHVGKDAWRVDYQFSRPVTAIKLDAVGDYRQKAWKLVTPGMRLTSEAGNDLIAAGGKPFSRASIAIQTFDGMAPKSYAPFNRFTDGGTALFLGHFNGEALRGTEVLRMRTDIRLKGLAQENVVAPPLNRLAPGGERGYAYFGPAQPVRYGAASFLLDPKTPAWMRETLLDAGAKMSAYYEKAYRRPYKDALLVMFSVSGFEEKGFSLTGGAVLGQVSYRFDSSVNLNDHPKYREMVARMVAHETAHLWQQNIDRGGIADDDPWVHEGGAEAMALDGLQQTGLWTPDTVADYRKARTALCDTLGNSVDSFDGIYACGLVRFDRAGMPIVPLWRAMMDRTEQQGQKYTAQMIETIASEAKGQQAATAR